MAIDDVLPHHCVLRVLISVLEVIDGRIFLLLFILLLLYLWHWLRWLLDFRHAHREGQAVFTEVLVSFVSGTIIVVILKLVLSIFVVLCLRYDGIAEKLVEVNLLIGQIRLELVIIIVWHI